MIWGCVTWEGVGTITAVNGNINAENYQEILDDNLWPVIVRHFRYIGLELPRNVSTETMLPP
jgi:hypothetical protein